MQTPYDADYFLNGVATGKSNYVNYSWQEGPTMALAKRVIEVMGIRPGDTFLDYGCARGYLVKALRRLGIEAFGHDISEWAIQNCDPEVRHVVSATRFDEMQVDHLWSKDTLEHISESELPFIIERMWEMVDKSVLFIVPLTYPDSDKYVRDEDNFDKTHQIRWALCSWMSVVCDSINDPNATLQGSWHIPGLKPTSLSHPKSCGFITLRRI